MSAAVSFGATVLGALLGTQGGQRQHAGPGGDGSEEHGAGLAGIARRGAGSSTVTALEQQLAECQAALEADLAAVQAEWDPADTALERVVVKPKRGGVSVQLVALVWQGK